MSPEPVQPESCFPSPPKVVPLPTAATNPYLDRPVFFRRTARDVLRAVAGEHIEITRPRRQCIEDTLARLEDLRQRLIARLDALDADPDLEPCLSCLDRWDQRTWCEGAGDDRAPTPWLQTAG